MNDQKVYFPCPVCGLKTRIREAYGTFRICPKCRWHDDNVQIKHPDLAGGANELSFNEFRERFLASKKSGDAVKADIKSGNL